MIFETPFNSPRAQRTRSFIAANNGDKYYGINAAASGPPPDHRARCVEKQWSVFLTAKPKKQKIKNVFDFFDFAVHFLFLLWNKS
jgi:hypothetical protein